MEFFAHDEVVARLERRANGDSQDVANMVALAWQLRQRNCTQALVWAQQAELLLVNGSYSHHIATLYALRIALVRAEVMWLKGNIDEAGQIAKQVLLQPAHPHVNDHDILQCLQADAHWLLGSLHNERGQLDARDSHWQTMRQLLLQASAPEKVTDRLGFIDAMIASTVSFRSTLDAEVLAQRYLNSDLSKIALATRAAIDDFLGLQVRMGNDLGRAAMYWINAFDAYSKTGQLRRAIHTANNIGNWFNKLNDPDTALKWTTLALNLARPTGWPQPIASCLIPSANAMRQMGKLDAAMALLQEALEILVNLRGSRSYAISLWSLGDMALARDDYKTALDAFIRLQECADQLEQGDFQTNARRGQAQALTLLGRYDEAIVVAEQALAMAATQNDVQGRIATLSIIAKIHAKHSLPPPPAMQGDSAPLHFLHQAYALANEIEGYTIPGDLLDAIAAAHAEAGDFRAAYEYSLRANSAREKTNSVAATNRANALQVQHQAEQARAESEHLRELAQEQAQRAQVLQNTSSTLAHLGAIGQEITAQLDPEAVCNTIKRHVQSLLEVSYFAIYLLDADGEHLTSI
ncbi:MAG: tetratricopeptide repeat protein, partial [Burkholderiales bacterium]|nr:tetratricopeptide repeat protein [Burkholderiales bacterium]